MKDNVRDSTEAKKIPTETLKQLDEQWTFMKESMTTQIPILIGDTEQEGGLTYRRMAQV